MKNVILELSDDDIGWLCGAVEETLARMARDPDMPEESLRIGRRLRQILDDLPFEDER